MKKLISCNLTIKSIIDNKEENIVISGDGYYKEEGNVVIVYFSCDGTKYKYIYDKEKLIIECGDSIYEFEEGVKRKGKIKNGNYVFEITTLANKLEIGKEKIILSYVLMQEFIIGEYFMELTIN